MTATLDAPDTASFTGFSYESVDVSRIPNRTPGRPGRTATPNPHTEIMARLAGTEDAVQFRLTSHDGQPWTEQNARKIVQRHTRWLRQAAHKNQRSVRVHWEMDGPELRIIAQDKEYKPRPPKAPDVTEDESMPDLSMPAFSGQ